MKNPPIYLTEHHKPANEPLVWLGNWVFLDPASPVRVQRMTHGKSLLHNHAFVELVFILGGHSRHTAAGVTHRLEAGQFFVVAEQQRHIYDETAALQVINLLIRNSFIAAHREFLAGVPGYAAVFAADGGPFYVPRRLTEAELQACLELVERLEQEGLGRTPGYVCQQEAWLLALIVQLCRFATQSRPAVAGARVRLAPVLAWLEQHLEADLPVSELAALAHLSERSLLRHFRTATGLTPHQYLLRLRLNQAARLLRESDASIAEIAWHCGFRDSNHFSYQFHRRMGCRATAFRRTSGSVA
jgi:AraC family transcriptional regulator, L-rhamnose operon regulatory protein RhaS